MVDFIHFSENLLLTFRNILYSRTTYVYEKIYGYANISRSLLKFTIPRGNVFADGTCSRLVSTSDEYIYATKLVRGVETQFRTIFFAKVFAVTV